MPSIAHENARGGRLPSSFWGRIRHIYKFQHLDCGIYRSAISSDRESFIRMYSPPLVSLRCTAPAVPRLATTVPAASAASPIYLIGVACVRSLHWTLSFALPMPITLYYLSTGLPRRDSLFGNPQNNHRRSACISNPFPGSVLLEAERRYGYVLVQNGVDRLSIFSGWHRSPSNRQDHYTLRGYNAAGWMVVTLEMEAGSGGKVYPYGQREWNCWLRKVRGNQARLQARHFFHLRDHVEDVFAPDYKLQDTPSDRNDM
ncbi:hypothetical protein F5146DRAFT_995343 [Armillaria mellea]|nr:hypothetical protein F5146DRAFT_995343 [Armillaria mellea]